MTRNAPKSTSTNKYRAPGPSGSAHSCFLEVIREDGSVTASGLADPRSSNPTHVAVHFDGASLSIAATFRPKLRQPVEDSIALPLDMGNPAPLLTLLDEEQPWKAWTEIEALVRQAMVDMQVPRRFTRRFDRHLHFLRAARNAPKVSEELRYFATEKARKKALFRLASGRLDCKIEGIIEHMQEDLKKTSAPLRGLTGYGKIMRHYQELLHEKQRREGLSKQERMDEDRRRLWEEERSRLRREARTSRP